MSMMIACTKGCGVALEVTDEMIEQAKTAGVPIDVSHEVCPRDEEQLPTYKVTVTVTRIEPGDTEGEQLASSGGSTEAACLADAMDELTKQLNVQWERVAQMRYVAEAPNADAPKATDA